MNRSAKATIFLLAVCVGVLGFLLFRAERNHRGYARTVQENSKRAIVSSYELNLIADGLEHAKVDTSELFLYYQYEWIRDERCRWNNEKVFSLAHLANGSGEYHDTLYEIWSSYAVASSEIRSFFIRHKAADDLKPGDLDELVANIRQLADATEQFENFKFDE